MHIEEILFVLGLKKNLLSISVLEDKGFIVTFMDDKALLWSKDKYLSSTIVIGVREGGLYKLSSRPTRALVHGTLSPCELWHRRFDHLHYKALPSL